MVICKNCNFENSKNAVKCEKCDEIIQTEERRLSKNVWWNLPKFVILFSGGSFLVVHAIKKPTGTAIAYGPPAIFLSFYYLNKFFREKFKK
jgi:ribosomal protein L40E